MSTSTSRRPSAAPRGKASNQRSRRTAPSRRSVSTGWWWAAIGAVVAVALVLAFALTRNDEVKQGTGSTVPGSGPVQLPDSQPVTVSGTRLVPYDSQLDDPAVGQQAPTLQGFSFDGTPVTVSAAEGPYMLVFLAHWCPHCNREIPVLQQWKAAGAVPEGLRVIGVATAVDPTLENYPPASWIERTGWDWPVLADQFTQARAPGLAANAFGAQGWPSFVVVGADGKVLVRHSGEIAAADLQALLDKVLSPA